MANLNRLNQSVLQFTDVETMIFTGINKKATYTITSTSNHELINNEIIVLIKQNGENKEYYLGTVNSIIDEKTFIFECITCSEAVLKSYNEYIESLNQQFTAAKEKFDELKNSVID